MDLREILELAIAVKGDQKTLAAALSIHPQWITEAKAGRRGLPPAICVELAKICELPEITAIAVSELVTEKNPARRKIWAPFVEGTRRAAAWVAGVMTALIMTTASNNADANERTFVSRMAGNPVFMRVSEGLKVSATNYAPFEIWRLQNSAAKTPSDRFHPPKHSLVMPQPFARSA